MLQYLYNKGLSFKILKCFCYAKLFQNIIKNEAKNGR